MKTLVLVPTQPELDRIAPIVSQSASAKVEICGFGIAAAAARTAQLIAREDPERVVLAGIAGRFADGPPVGTATAFARVVCCGIGVGFGDQYESAGDLGWNHFHDIGDEIPLAPVTVDAAGRHAGGPGQLLTVAAASATIADADDRQRRYPNAVAEDMEGFGVALACALFDVRLTVVRGISNTAGDRNKDHWQIVPALQAAAEMTAQVCGRETA